MAYCGAVERLRKTKFPCQGCGLHQSLCLCDQIPNLNLRSKLLLVVHFRELRRTTNTGQLAVRAVNQSAMHVRGLTRERQSLKPLLDPNCQPLLFFPSEDAAELTPAFLQQFDRPIQLIVPDGNWRQASKVHTRYPELQNIPRVKITEKNRMTQFLRRETTDEGMATLQAIAKAFAMIESPEVGAQLMSLYNLKLQRTLIGRRGGKNELSSS